MKAKFTFDEMIYNSIVQNKQIYYNNGINEELKTISYVKLIKSTRQIQVHCTDNSIFLLNQDDQVIFEVNEEKILVKPNLPKNKKK